MQCLLVLTSCLHLFPFRTEKLSPVTPMVLRNSGRVGSRRFFSRVPAVVIDCGGFFYVFLPAVPFFLPRNASRSPFAPCPSPGFCRNLVPCTFYLAPCAFCLLSYALFLMLSCRRLWPCWGLFNARQCQSSSGLLSAAQVDNLRLPEP